MRRLFILAGLLGGAVSVAAQTGNTPRLEDPRFEETLIVSASLEEEEADALSASVEVIEAAEIISRQATNIADLLKTVPGLTVLSSGSAGKVTSLFSRGTESDHTLVLWNGVELNNPFFGGFDWAFLPTEGVRRIEIVRGPFSAIHGSDAVGGVVQVLTGDRAGGSVRIEAGENRYRRAAFETGLTRPSGQIEVRGHVRQGDGEAENDFFDGSEMAVSGRWFPSEALSVSLVARVNESDNGIPFSGGLPSPEREISWSERQLAVPVSYRKGDWEVSGLVSSVAYTTSFSDPQDAFGFTASETDSAADRFRVSAVRRFLGESWLAFGSEVERLEVDDRSVFGTNLDGARQSTRSVFAQAAHNLGPVRLDLGFRHDDNDAFGSRTTPKLGAMVLLGKRTRVRASWGEGFRAPSVGELFYPFSGNPALEPEQSESWEAGIEYSKGAWRLGMTAFENDLVNLIDFDFVTFTNRNVGRARTRGFEAWSRYSGGLVEVLGSATALASDDLVTGEPLLRRPDESLSLVVSADPGAWDLSFSAAYVGSRPDVDPATFGRVTLESHVRLDLACRFEKRNAVQPYVRIENLADRSYEEVAGYPAPGRRLIAGFATAWK